MEKIIRLSRTAKLIFILSLVLFCTAGTGRAATPTVGNAFPIATPPTIALTLPSATITVDGNTTDWTGIDPLVTDPTGDDSSSYSGDDIQALYAAKDIDNLYLRMDLTENANTDFGNGPSPYEGRYVFAVAISTGGTYSELYLGIAYDQTSTQWALGYNGSNGGSVPTDLQGPGYVGVSGNVIELKVPLSMVGGPVDFIDIRAEVENCCVADFVTLDETASVSQVGTAIAFGGAFDGTNYLVGVQGNYLYTPTTGDGKAQIAAQLVSQAGENVGGFIAVNRTGGLPSAAFDGTNFLLVWEDDATDPNDLYGQFIDTSGNPLNSPFSIASAIDEVGGIAFGGGNYLVVYYKEDSATLNDKVYGRIVSPSGTVGAEIAVSTGFGKFGFHNIAFDGTNFLVVWTDDDNDYEVRGRFVGPDGTLGTELSINASPDWSDNPLTVAFDGTNYLVVWMDEEGAGTKTGVWHILGQFVTTSGTLSGDAITITTTGSQFGPTLAFDGSTDYLVVWTEMGNDANLNWVCDSGEGTCFDIYGRFVSTSGALVGDTFAVSTEADNQLGGVVGYHDGKYFVGIGTGVTVDPEGQGGLVGKYVYGLFILYPVDSDSDGISDDVDACNNPNAPSGLISYWGFNDGSGTTAVDSYDSNPGTIYGATWATGIVDGALSFNDNYVSVPNTESLNPSYITVEAWVYPTSYGYYRNIVGKGYGSSWELPWIVYQLRPSENTGKPQFWVTVGGTNYAAVGNDVVPINTWTHWVGTYDGETVKIYVDGMLAASNTIPSGPLDYRPDASLYIGSVPGTNNYYYGKIDEVAIYNRALTLEEIQQHYQNGLTEKGYCEAVAEPPTPFYAHSYHQDAASGYFIFIFVDDPTPSFSAVTVSGTGLAGDVSMTYNAESGRWEIPSVALGTDLPADPSIYNFAATPTAGGEVTGSVTVSVYVEQFATNLQPAGDVDTAQPTFSWTGFAEATSYAVSLRDIADNEIWVSSQLGPGETSVLYNGPDLTAGQTYQYTVISSINTDGNSNSSFAEAQFTYTGAADTIAPSAPNGLTATGISSSQIDLSWTASTDSVGVTGYKVYWDGIEIGTTVSPSFSDTGLTASTNYCYTVKAYDLANNLSDASIEACATTLSGGTVITLKSDSSTLAAAVGSPGAPDSTVLSRLDTADTTDLTFVPVSVGAFGTVTSVPPGAPAETVVVNIPQGDEQNGYFKLTFTLPSDFTNAHLTGAANVDDKGRVFLNSNPLTSSIVNMDQNTVTQFGNVVFSTSNAEFFMPGMNEILISDANTGAGPSGGAFYAIITYDGSPPSVVKGDVDGNGAVTLADAILALQVIVGMNPAGIELGADVNGDNKIGLAEVIYILQYVAGLRADKATFFL